MSNKNSTFDLKYHKVVGKSKSSGAAPWVRPSEWPALTTIGSSDDKLTFLVQVDNDGDTTTNYCGVSADIVGGYTVDWGDGTSNNYATGVTGTHFYNYSNVNLTSTSYGYKCAVVTITAQNTANKFTTFSFKNPTNPLVGQKVLDFNARIPNVTALTLSTSLQKHVRQFQLGTNSIASFASMFSGFSNLCYIPSLYTNSGTNFTSMFSGCSSLGSVPLFDTSSGITFASMFLNCYNLETIPLFITSSGTNFSYMFASCYSITSTPLLNTTSGTNFSGMFQNCYNITSIPLLDTSSGTSFNSMFINCYSITSTPLLNTSNGNNFTSMFSGCSSLTTIPLLDTSKGTNFNSMFQNCYALTSIPALDWQASTSQATHPFSGCVCLVNIGITFRDSLNIIASGLRLSSTAIDAIFDNLPYASGSKNINVSTNPGRTTCTTSKATSKGWTVT